MRLRASLVTLAGALGVLVCLALPHLVLPAQAQPSIGGAYAGTGGGSDNCSGKACSVQSLTATSDAGVSARVFTSTVSSGTGAIILSTGQRLYLRNDTTLNGYLVGSTGELHWVGGTVNLGNSLVFTTGNFRSQVASGSNGFGCDNSGCRFDHGTGTNDYTASDGADVITGGGFGLNAAGTAKPACSSTHRGKLWFTRSAAGVADVTEVCRKDAADAYGWVAL